MKYEILRNNHYEIHSQIIDKNGILWAMKNLEGVYANRKCEGVKNFKKEWVKFWSFHRYIEGDNLDDIWEKQYEIVAPSSFGKKTNLTKYNSFDDEIFEEGFDYGKNIIAGDVIKDENNNYTYVTHLGYENINKFFKQGENL